MAERREKFSEYFMYLTFGMWLAGEVLLSSNLERILWWDRTSINSAMAMITLYSLMIQIVFFQHYSINEVLIVSLCSIIIAIATLNSGYNIMMSTWLFVIASKYVNFDKVIKISYMILILTMAIIFFMYYTGQIDDSVIYRGSMIRHSWGFTHPNVLGVRVFQLVLSHCYLRKQHITIIDYGIIALASWYVYRVPNCKTAFFGLVIFGAMLLIYKAENWFVGGQVFFIKILVLIAIVVNVLSVILSIINVKAYPFLAMIDKRMSYRFSTCFRTLKYYGIKLLGQEINLYISRMGVLMRRFYIDTSYVAILVRYGIGVYLIFSILYIVAMIYCLKKNNHFMVIVLSMYAIYGIMENSFFAITQNFFLIALSFPLYATDNIGQDIEQISKRVRIKLSW